MKPIIAVAPMDGITDAAFRFIIDKYGQPDAIYTEFVSAKGIICGSPRLLQKFFRHQTTTATIAQLFGNDPADFYKATVVAADLGFDGIDINMGCPDNNVIKKNAGGALIKQPQLAIKIINETKKAVDDWFNGKQITDLNLKSETLDFVKLNKNNFLSKLSKKILPVSVKTRIGYDKIVTVDWINCLLEAKPSQISIHGRLVKQLYKGEVYWSEIAKAKKLAQKTNVLILGNGNVKTIAEAREKAKQYNLDGILIGRAMLGNPWLFKNYVPSLEERIKVILEHCQVFISFFGELNFQALRKHLLWYTKGFVNASRLRRYLTNVNNIDDVRAIFADLSAYQ